MQQLFVAETDELWERYPELALGALVPYQPGMHCMHWLEVVLNPDESEPLALQAPQRKAA